MSIFPSIKEIVVGRLTRLIGVGLGLGLGLMVIIWIVVMVMVMGFCDFLIIL